VMTRGFATLSTVHRWAVASSIVAPIAMIGGWSVAAARQPPGYSSIRQTISALASDGAHDRWVMTIGLAVVGACHVVTAGGLRPARAAGRILLAIGGMATMVVAAVPQPVHGSSPGHTLAAGTAFVTLSWWPLAAHTSRSPVGALRLPVAAAATAVSLVLLAVFFIELHGGDQVGLTERLLAGTQSLWPAVVALSAFRSARRSRLGGNQV
jgi:hypothetical membrane protein